MLQSEVFLALALKIQSACCKLPLKPAEEDQVDEATASPATANEINVAASLGSEGFSWCKRYLRLTPNWLCQDFCIHVKGVGAAVTN